MRLYHDIPSRLARLTWTVLFTLAWSGFVDVARAEDCRCGAVDPVAESQPADSPGQMAQRLDRVFETIERLQRDQPRDTFDPAAVVRRVGKDPN